MWAQMIKQRARPGKETEIKKIAGEISGEQQTGGAMTDFIVFQDEHARDVYYTLIFFRSEQDARTFESSPQASEIQEKMSRIFEGGPEFVDLVPVYDSRGKG